MSQLDGYNFSVEIGTHCLLGIIEISFLAIHSATHELTSVIFSNINKSFDTCMRSLKKIFSIKQHLAKCIIIKNE